MTTRTMRMLLRENKVLRILVYPLARWIMVDVLKLRERNIKKYGYDAVALIDKVSISVGMPCYAYAGTLLGFIRDKGFISYDPDMDYAMMPDNGKVGTFFHALEKNGFYFERFIVFDGRLREFSMRYKEISIDFFARYYKDDSRTEFINYGDKQDGYWGMSVQKAPMKLIPYTVNGVQTHIPDNYDEMLTDCYGDWRTPVKDWNDNMAPTFTKDYGEHEQYLSRNRTEWIAFLEEHNP